MVMKTDEPIVESSKNIYHSRFSSTVVLYED